MKKILLGLIALTFSWSIFADASTETYRFQIYYKGHLIEPPAQFVVYGSSGEAWPTLAEDNTLTVQGVGSLDFNARFLQEYIPNPPPDTTGPDCFNRPGQPEKLRDGFYKIVMTGMECSYPSR